MKICCVDELNLENKKVFVRIDIDSGSLNNKKILSSKLEICLPTIKYIIDQGAKVVIGTHLGIQNILGNKITSIEEVGLLLSAMLNKDIFFLDEVYNDAFKKLMIDFGPGSVILLENLALLESEIKNNDNFSSFISTKVDYYVNEAITLSNSSLASLYSVLDYFERDKIAIGLNFKYEFENLNIIKNSAKKPFIVIINGKDVSQKVEFLGLLLDKIDKIIVMGIVSNSFNKVVATDFSGNYEKDALYSIKKLISSAKARNLEIIRTGVKASSDKLEIDSNNLEYLLNLIQTARNIIWIGPVEGMSDMEQSFKNSLAFKSTLGNEAYFSLNESSYKNIFDYISTADTVSLDYLVDKPLIVIEKLREL
ncbi:MAG: phosphoglycerate kinase [Thermodesulfobacteriota bacterium]